jgi:large subunit ribosomal protein L29
MKPMELRSMSLDELRGELADQQRALYNLRFRKSVGEDINATEMKKTRREIARVKTILSEKENELAAQVAATGESEQKA